MFFIQGLDDVHRFGGGEPEAGAGLDGAQDCEFGGGGQEGGLSVPVQSDDIEEAFPVDAIGPEGVEEAQVVGAQGDFPFRVVVQPHVEHGQEEVLPGLGEGGVLRHLLEEGGGVGFPCGLGERRPCGGEGLCVVQESRQDVAGFGIAFCLGEEGGQFVDGAIGEDGGHTVWLAGMCVWVRRVLPRGESGTWRPGGVAIWGIGLSLRRKSGLQRVRCFRLPSRFSTMRVAS